MQENRTYYKKKIVLALFVITVIFGLQTLYTYYSAKISDPLQLLSAVLYGTIKLFLFVSPISAEEKSSIFYEFAKWMAPILTSAFIFTQISNILLHVKNMLLNRTSMYHVLIFENTEMGETLIGNLMKERTPYKISLITKNFLDDRLKNKYEKKGIATYQIDFEHCDENEIRELFSALHIHHAKYIFFCSDNDLENYALYANVIKRIKPRRPITCYANCSSNTVVGYMEELLSEERKGEELLKKIDTVHFNQKDLTVRMLLAEPAVKRSILKSLEGISEDSQIADSIEDSHHMTDSTENSHHAVDSIENSIKPLHVLLFSVNDLTLPLLKQLANDATTSLARNPKISILEENASQRMQELLDLNAPEREGLLRALEIECIDLGHEQRNLQNYLKGLGKEESPSLIFLMQEDVVKSLKALKLMNRYFGQVPKVLRNISNVDLTHVLPKSKDKIKVFGDLSEIMTGEILIREALDNRAKQFNEAYNKASRAAGMGEGTAWNELSYVKKNSSRQSATHAGIKEEIIRRVLFGKSEQEISAYLSEKLEEFKKLQEAQKLGGENRKEEFQQNFRRFLSENPLLDFLSRLEHKRWCNSYYAMNFRYGEKKDENLKTHPCLIEDWGEVIGEKFDICHPEYDLLSVFTLFREEE
ncbi:hypothetical protein HNQ46_000136 [Oribacterium sinus]|uniref:Uncharacterized protein n=1 Tax=Oribacterium sinus TaxID=237576 RepID=A0A7W9W0T8_9FIRM|nr:hypothetical protein [Oribacterium sinus]MBB6040175.1 hypothetical protein [Oribacterium sinus]